jgi:hypothetical protein
MAKAKNKAAPEKRADHYEEKVKQICRLMN